MYEVMRLMKRLTRILLMVALTGLLGSCNNWLDVKPYDSMTEAQLYSTEAGIQKALNGIYLSLASNSLYAKDMTCGAVDVLSQRWDILNEHGYYELSTFQYGKDNPKATFEGIWKSAYKLIADCNEFLQEVPKHQEVLPKDEYPVYKGEVLAVRTFLHFDLFRLFGAAYTPEGRLQSGVPYYGYVTDVPTPILTGEAMMKHLIADIDTAILWLTKDPVLTAGVGKEESFWDHRNFRLNYYAAWALKARMYWYMGEDYKTEAFQIASSLLAGNDPKTGEANNFTDVFKSFSELTGDDGVTADVKTQDRVYQAELLFALHNMKRNALYKAVFSLDLEDKNILWAQADFITRIYSEDGDIRKYSWDIVSSDRGSRRAFVKFNTYKAFATDPYRYETQSLIRLGELYLIAASTTDDVQTKRQYLEQLRLKRGFSNGNAAGVADLDGLLDLEYQREFYGEGQYFYFLKRNQIKTIKNNYQNTVTMDYDIPLPESETNNRYE